MEKKVISFNEICCDTCQNLSLLWDIHGRERVGYNVTREILKEITPEWSDSITCCLAWEIKQLHFSLGSVARSVSNYMKLQSLQSTMNLLKNKKSVRGTVLNNKPLDPRIENHCYWLSDKQYIAKEVLT